MIAVAGFLIAVMVGMTGVGGGVLTVPVLMLLFGVDPLKAVGAALIFAAAIKLILVPLVAFRGQVNWRVLGWMLLGGTPGVFIGGFAIRSLAAAGAKSYVQFLLGLIVLTAASLQLRYALMAARERNAVPSSVRDRRRLLGFLMSFVGAEVGFSSAGAGALGSVALLSFTRLNPLEVVGTDLAFGLVLSTLAGGLHLSFGNVDRELVMQLLAGGLPGAICGSLLASQVSPRGLKLVLSTSLIGIGINLCWQAVAR